MTFPPPTPTPLAPQPRAWRQNVAITVLVGGVVAVGLLAYSGSSDRDRDRDDGGGGGRMTLTEAVCGMLNDGEDPEFVYDVAKDLAADHPLVYGEDESVAARAAVTRAQAQGCG